MTPNELRNRALLEWRGLPSFTRTMTDSAKPLGSFVEKVMKDWGLATRLREEEVKRCWAEIVGDFVGRHSAPHRLADGVLIVHVLQPTLRYELERVWKKDILAKLQARFDRKTVRDLKFHIG